jgi:hypothetical protein
MTATKNITRTKRFLPLAEALTSLGLFLLTLLPRAYDLPRFVTADEAKWVYRSAQFLAAFLRGDFAATSVNLTPAVTTTWLGSLGLAFYYWLYRTTIGLPLTDWLMSLPEFRTELDVLVAVRWPMVIFTSLGVVAIYLLARCLFNPTLAFIAAAFVALDPHTVALSRILGHDAPTAVFMPLSLLLLLLAVLSVAKQKNSDVDEESPPLPRSCKRSGAPLLLITLSGVMAGLAFLSKAPAFFLVPFAVLMLAGRVWGHSTTLYFWFKRFLLWIVVAYLTFIVFWPAAWVDPLGRPLAVVENAFLSATDQEEAEAEGYWLVPDLGLFYYLVNGGFKLSPLVMVGAGLAIWQVGRSAKQRGRKLANEKPTEQASANSEKSAFQSFGSAQDKPPIPPTSRSLILWLLVFVLLFTIFMTFSDKRSARYILPVFPPLALVAAFGWLKLWHQVSSVKCQVTGSKVTGNKLYVSRLTPHVSRFIFPLLLTLSAFVILLPYAPYYFTYFNPLLGGPYTAPHLVKIGWGEGLDQVGRFLQRELSDSRVGTVYASTVAPFFKGDLSGVTGDNLDYVVLYRKQVQSGEPSPTFIRYFEHFAPIFSVDQNGIRYADVYPGPALQPALALTPGLDHAILPKPIGFRPLTLYGHTGQPLAVDVLWLADDPLPDTPSTVTLEPISAFDFLNEHNHPDGTPAVPREITVLAEGQGRLTRLADNLIVSRHHLELPADLERGRYALLVDERPLGEVELRHFQVPVEMGQVNDIIFGDQVTLAAYQFEPAEDYISVTIAWQAQRSHLPDYTVFVQLLEAETNERLAGVDTQPVKGEWPTSHWVKNEVVVDEYVVAVPPDLPPGFYQVIVGLYRSETGQRLVLADGQDHWALPWTFIREK